MSTTTLIRHPESASAVSVLSGWDGSDPFEWAMPQLTTLGRLLDAIAALV